MKTALVIPIYNRQSYVSRCFESLEKLTVKPDFIILIDDGSSDRSINGILSAFKDKWGVTCQHLRGIENRGVKKALITGIDFAWGWSLDITHIITLDSDAIVTPDFVERLTDLWEREKMVCSGFNNPKEPVIHTLGTSVIKAHANGINMCFDREQYDKHIKPALLKPTGNWDYDASESAGSVAITIPSCVQHIGLVSSMGHVGSDIAHDFILHTLKDVTLFGIDSHDKKGIMRAAEISCRSIEFGDRNIILDDLFTKNGSREQRRADYSRFMIRELTKHFTTSHVLTIHADGYILNPFTWQDEWLQYDYIGATWWYKDGMNVGNGGFSLRSKKLCDILATYDLAGEHYHPEDHAICRTYRPALEALGIKFAPAEVADKFSLEGHHSPNVKYTGQFGFHGTLADYTGHEQYGVVSSDIYKHKQIQEPQKRMVVHEGRKRIV